MFSIQISELLRKSLLGLSIGLCFSTAYAEEGGTGHYTPGGMATLIDQPPVQAGWVIQPIYLHYDGEYSVSKTLPIAGVVSTGLNAKIDALTLGGLYTFEEQVFDAYFSVGVYVPYMSMEVEGIVNNRSRTDTVNGIGDITLIPVMLAWQVDAWALSAMLPIYVPTGEYELGELANLGLNYWTFDPTVGAAYSNEKTGLSFQTYVGITFNTENDKTHYRSGSVLHAEASVEKLWVAGNGMLGMGLNGFIYEQISGDSGSGATNGDFKGRSIGIGPVINYILPAKSGTWVFEAKWLPELNTKNRLEGDYVWVKAVYQF